MDIIDPILYFYSYVGNTASGYTISSYLTSSLPAYAGGATYSNMGYTFSTSISLSIYGTNSVIDKDVLSTLLIDYIQDDRDGTMSITTSNITLLGTNSTEVSSITSTGTYSMIFDFSDIAQNYLDGVIVYLDITT